MREQYNATTAERLIDNLPIVENILNIHINRLTEWDIWERLVHDWLAFCEDPEQYADSIVVDMIKLYLN